MTYSTLTGLALSFLLAACGTSGPDGDAVDGGPSSSGTTDGGTLVAPHDNGPDFVPVFEIGYNDQGKVTSDHFYAVTGGAEAPIVKGSQGAWMLVVAARANQFPADVTRVDVEAELGPAGESPFGKLKFKRRPILDGGDGFRYLMNVFLVVANDDTVWDGKKAVLRVALESESGIRVEDQAEVILVKTLEE